MKDKSMLNELFPDGNHLIEEAIAAYYAEGSKKKLVGVLTAIRQRIHEDGQFLFPIFMISSRLKRSRQC